MSTAPWILATSQPLGVQCTRCGTGLLFSQPVPIDRFLSDGRAFTEQHKRCPGGQETPPAQEEALGIEVKDVRTLRMDLDGADESDDVDTGV